MVDKEGPPDSGGDPEMRTGRQSARRPWPMAIATPGPIKATLIYVTVKAVA